VRGAAAAAVVPVVVAWMMAVVSGFCSIVFFRKLNEIE
jgi:hypothetical protein